MDRIERLAGRLANDVSRLALSGDSQENQEEFLETATLVNELTDELAASRSGAARNEPRFRLWEAWEPRADASSRVVLLVEAVPEDREELSGMLLRLGCDVLEAPDGAEALRLCSEHPGPIQLLLTSVFTPDLSGRELAEHAALLRPDLSVIYMSGYADDEIVFRGILGPGVAALTKPVSEEALAEKLAETPLVAFVE